MTRRAFTMSVGDRDLPLEADLDDGVLDRHTLVGSTVEVSPIAGGDILGLRGKKGEVTGVVVRLGEPVGLRVTIEKKQYFGSLKDFFTDREVLEDIEPPTPTSKSVREALVHWTGQRTYWHQRIDGLESLCFELAAVTPRACVVGTSSGWQFCIPDPMPGRHTVVDCRAVLHGNFWSLSVMVFPVNEPLPGNAPEIPNHWARTFSWANKVAKRMISKGFPWQKSLENMLVRAKFSAKVLEPMTQAWLKKAIAVKKRLTGSAPEYPQGSICAAVSTIRLKPGYAGLTEPPTDRRPYTVISINPSVAKNRKYLSQVVLHECIHAVVFSKGGEPHNEEFMQLAEILGLDGKYRN